MGRGPAVLGVISLLAIGLGCGRNALEVDGAPARAVEPIGPRGRPPPARIDAGPCVPAAETCNGLDDDCDGTVDELPAMACEGGGSRYCVAGSWSECPRRCDFCRPGSERICFVGYCTYWATQRCSADGLAMGPCVELEAPPECIDIAREHHRSPELEQCCIDNGYCCRDDHDLDGDGYRAESIGACAEVTCTSD